MHIFYEALIVGCITAIIGLIVTYSLTVFKTDNFNVVLDWEHIIFPFFATGFLFHLLAEWFGANKYYCNYKKNE
jgi:ABC-type antimicrobial peptide transport system permease subunit